jgi:hypothetical protein
MAEPVRGVNESLAQEGDIEAEMCGARIEHFLVFCEEIEKEGADTMILEGRGDKAIAGTFPPAAAAVSEKDHAESVIGNGQVTSKSDIWEGNSKIESRFGLQRSFHDASPAFNLAEGAMIAGAAIFLERIAGLQPGPFLVFRQMREREGWPGARLEGRWLQARLEPGWKWMSAP